MRRVPLRPEILLAIAAGLVGLISVVSALTPSIAARSDLVHGVLPPGVPSAARSAALAFGLLLIWLSYSLARRKRNAWLLAVAVVVLSAAAHLAKGLDFEEALASLLLLAALVHYRRRFDVPGDPAALRPLMATALVFASLAAYLVVYELHPFSALEDLEDIVTATAAFLAAHSLYLWFRPVGERARASVGERRQARALVERYGHDSLAFFSLRHDKTYFFSPSRRAFLAYRVIAGCALVSGDPIGDASEFAALVEEFQRVAHSRGWRLAVLGASGELLPVYRSVGLRVFKLGDEAVVRPAAFSLEGRPIRKVRQSVHRLRRAGYRVRVLRAAELDASLRAALDDVSNEWLGNWPERGFTMAMDSLYRERDAVLAVAEDASGTVGGFLHLVPSPAAAGYSLGAMRRRRSTPNGLMEFLITEVIEWGHQNDVSQIALNFCVFADAFRVDCPRSRAGRAVGFALVRFDRVFQLRRLFTFSAKFFPDWHPRYLCFERLTDFPVVGIAYLRVESLLTPPVPWARMRRARQPALQE
jgi:lysyl-tRNA synthetase, class II